MIMNQAKWAQISEADQAAINKLSGEALARRAGKAWDAADARGEKAVREANIPIVTASPQFVAEIKDKTSGLEQAWIEKVKAKGVDGAAVLAALRPRSPPPRSRRLEPRSGSVAASPAAAPRGTGQPMDSEQAAARDLRPR